MHSDFSFAGGPDPETGGYGVPSRPDVRRTANSNLPVGRPVTHGVYRDAFDPSRLVLPFTTRAVEAE
ncbi:hypothetical protein ACI789_00915 [Geodermatophilus sp. SYSU D00965]